MNSPKPRPATEINLEEFERRLRASAAPQAGVEDPLAELTRLVDAIGFERSPTERLLEQSRPARPASKTEAPAKPPLPPAAALPAPPPAHSLAPAPAPAAEALPPSEVPAADALRPTLDADDFDAISIEPLALEAAEEAPRGVASDAKAPRAAPRARHWRLKVGGLLAAAAVMAGAVVVLKFVGHGSSGAPPLILASVAPTKVAPPSEATVRTANESGALLTHDTAQPTPTPPKLVNTPEAPVDLSARPEPSAAPSAATASPAGANFPTGALSAPSGADNSPVAASSDTPIVPAPASPAPPAAPAGADPSRVKTISVRPDGTLIASGYEAAPPPPPPQTPSPADRALTANADPDGAVKAPSPAVALPTKLSPPKSVARVAPVDPADAPPAAPSPKPKKPKPTPTPVAEAEPPADAKPEAKTDDAAATDAPTGGYAVQLAAPRSESDANGLVKSLGSRYADALNGQTLGVHKAQRDGSPIFRVRASGLSKGGAVGLCKKIKAAGGDCYVAKN